MPPVRQPAPVWFRVVAILLLLWGAMGVWACVQQIRLGAAAMGAPSAYDRALFAALPAWYDWVYAVAVGSGFLGAVALLARRAVARLLFVVSLVGVVVMFGWMFAQTDIVVVKGIVVAAGFPALIFVIAIAQLMLADRARRRGWIG